MKQLRDHDVVDFYRYARQREKASSNDLEEAILILAAEHSEKLALVQNSISSCETKSVSKESKRDSLVDSTFSILKWFKQVSQPGFAVITVMAITAALLPNYFVTKPQHQEYALIYDTGQATSVHDLLITQNSVTKSLRATSGSQYDDFRYGRALAYVVASSPNEIMAILELPTSSALNLSKVHQQKITNLANKHADQLEEAVLKELGSNKQVFAAYWLTILKASLLRFDDFSKESFIATKGQVKQGIAGTVSKDLFSRFDVVYQPNNSVEVWYEYTTTVLTEIGL